MKKVSEILAKRLRDAREQAGLSLDAVASSAQIEQSRIEQIESGEVMPEPAELLRLSGSYALHPSELFEGIDASDIPASLSEDIEHLISELLQQDAPGRGDAFKDMVKAISSSTDH